eukprot:COSAG06_NODE_44506_length_363_cov_0.553030_1_plen_51_part_10
MVMSLSDTHPRHQPLQTEKLLLPLALLQVGSVLSFALPLMLQLTQVRALHK